MKNKTETKNPSRGVNGNQGMNWIKPTKRLAIYIRDGLACAYCGDSIEQGAKLTLDHLTARSQGGKNSEDNLVTACVRCNSSRGDRDWKNFADSVADYLDHGIRPSDIIIRISGTIRRPLDVEAAKTLIAARGGFTAALTWR